MEVVVVVVHWCCEPTTNASPHWLVRSERLNALLGVEPPPFLLLFVPIFPSFLVLQAALHRKSFPVPFTRLSVFVFGSGVAAKKMLTLLPPLSPPPPLLLRKLCATQLHWQRRGRRSKSPPLPFFFHCVWGERGGKKEWVLSIDDWWCHGPHHDLTQVGDSARWKWNY